MSDLNDDLLNYELGEELDDPTLLAGDEDELLLSDEELEKDVTDEQKVLLKEDAENWLSSKLKIKKSSSKDDIKKTDNVVTTSCNETISEKNNLIKNGDTTLPESSDVSTSEEAPQVIQQIQEKHPREEVENELLCKNDEVTSTNKEIGSQTGIAESKSKSISSVNYTKKDDLIHSSQENLISEANVHENISVSVESEKHENLADPREDLEERGERMNIKHANERDDKNISPGKYQSNRFFSSKRGRGSPRGGGHFSGARPTVKYPHLQYPPQYNQNPNENAHPSQYPYPSVDNQLGIRQSFGITNQMPPRMEFRPPMVPNYRLQNPEFGYRGQHPDFPLGQVNGSLFYAPSVQVRPNFRLDGNMPQGQIRHRMPVPPRQLGIPTQNQIQTFPTPVPQPHIISNTGNPNNFTVVANFQPGPNVAKPVISRKVLINPNFKGGVEAATNQFMKDTQFIKAIDIHAMHLQSDEELLRQQEEFIKKNRMHIEKRRHERSPERSRSRERSYSPPRRDKRGNSRERRGISPRGRIRRANSPEGGRFLKKRRSSSFERRREKEKPEEEEDEETRAYRQEIEKQKAMREKILRDKEMRRRKAAEGKQVEEKPVSTSTDDPPQKLKPIIVTESKIISLKKKSNLASDSGQVKSKSSNSSIIPQLTIQKAIPTAKILPEAKRAKIEDYHNFKDSASTVLLNTAVIKPVIQKTISIQADIESKSKKADDDTDDEYLDEDLLLAETPSPPSSPPPCIKTKLTQSTKVLSEKLNSGGSSIGFTNRRVVLKSGKDDSKRISSNLESNRKPIFERLERKKIAVHETAKRKIQRIVIKNAE